MDTTAMILHKKYTNQPKENIQQAKIIKEIINKEQTQIEIQYKQIKQQIHNTNTTSKQTTPITQRQPLTNKQKTHNIATKNKNKQTTPTKQHEEKLYNPYTEQINQGTPPQTKTIPNMHNKKKTKHKKHTKTNKHNKTRSNQRNTQTKTHKN